MTIKSLKKEIRTAKENENKFIQRFGCQYEAEGYQFDDEIQARRRFAIEWREKALDIMANHNGSYRILYKNMWPAEGYSQLIRRKFHVFTIQGKDVLIVCPSLPSTDHRHIEELGRESAEEWILTKIGIG